MFIEFRPMLLSNVRVIVLRVHWSVRSFIPNQLSIGVTKSICDVDAKEYKLALSTTKDALPGCRRLRQVGTKLNDVSFCKVPSLSSLPFCMIWV